MSKVTELIVAELRLTPGIWPQKLPRSVGKRVLVDLRVLPSTCLRCVLAGHR